MYRALHKAQAIRERLGSSATMTEPFPKRPKGMHHGTYMRLFWERDEAEVEQLAGMRGVDRPYGEEGRVASLGVRSAVLRSVLVTSADFDPSP